MRDGRRKRLGLAEGTENPNDGLSYLDNILSDADVAGQPNILNLDTDANVRKEMLRHMKNAETLGVDEDKIAEIFQKRGIPISDVARLTEGLFKPFYPGVKVRQRFEDIAAQTNSINPYEEAEDILLQMREDFLEQSLYQKFEFKLEDYLPGSQPQGANPNLVDFGDQSSLDTPGVNPANFNTASMDQGAIGTTGLTSTEQALLSPEEQAIRLRQRGQA